MARHSRTCFRRCKLVPAKLVLSKSKLALSALVPSAVEGAEGSKEREPRLSVAIMAPIFPTHPKIKMETLTDIA